MVSSVWRYEPLNPVCALCLIGSRILSPLFPVPYPCVLCFFLPYLLLVSPWWNSCLTTMKLTLYTCVNDAQHVRKECGIREKRMRNTWKRNAGTGGKRFANRWNVNVLPLKQMFFDRTVIVSCNISWFYYHPLVNLLESLTEFVNPYREVKLLDFIGLEYSYHKNGW